jgi:hypothetical protein
MIYRTGSSRVIRRNTNRRHMTGDHHGRTARRATLLVRAVDAILGTHRVPCEMRAGNRRQCTGQFSRSCPAYVLSGRICRKERDPPAAGQAAFHRLPPAKAAAGPARTTIGQDTTGGHRQLSRHSRRAAGRWRSTGGRQRARRGSGRDDDGGLPSRAGYGGHARTGMLGTHAGRDCAAGTRCRIHTPETW